MHAGLALFSLPPCPASFPTQIHNRALWRLVCSWLLVTLLLASWAPVTLALHHKAVVTTCATLARTW